MRTANNFSADSLDFLYRDIAREILHNGEEVTARGLKFKEARFIHAVLTNPRNRIIQNVSRAMSMKFAVAEFIWMMSGKDDLEMISEYNKRMLWFSDDGVMLHGAYGPRLRNWKGAANCSMDQIGSCLERMKNDIFTRQAVITILDPSLDLAVPTKDIPCNDLLQFMYREGKLHLACYVRSNDLLWGVPYDIFHWTLLQELFAKILEVPLGEYHHFVGSMHIYEKDYEKFADIIRNTPISLPMHEMTPQHDLSVIEKLMEYEEGKRLHHNSCVELDPYWSKFVEHLGY